MTYNRSPHNKLSAILCGLHVLPACVWVFSGYSSFLSHTKNMYLSVNWKLKKRTLGVSVV